jgi:hypothetical protein
MKSKTLSYLAAFSVGLLFTLTPASLRAQQRMPAPVAPPTPAASAIANILTQALAGPDGEYAAHAEYSAIVQKFGAVQPYANILNAEERHIAALTRLFEIRGLAVPEDTSSGNVQVPATLQAAADASVTAEERNVALYAQLLDQVEGQPDLVRVFTQLQWASRERHLPAFKAAAANGGQVQAGFCVGMGGGQGRGGPPAWGRGCQQNGGCGACGLGLSGQSPAAPNAGRGHRYGVRNQLQNQ